MDIKIMRTALKNNGYCIDNDACILHMTKAFNKKSCIYGTNEYFLRNKILSTMPLTTKIHEKRHTNNTIPYIQMERYIKLMPNSEKMLEEFAREKLKSTAHNDPYVQVSNWFYKTYPHYHDHLIMDKDGNKIWDTEKISQQSVQ